MIDDETTPEQVVGSPAAFEADMRSRRELMVQMAGREHYDFDPVWIRIGRLAITIALYLVAFAAIAFVVWKSGGSILEG